MKKILLFLTLSMITGCFGGFGDTGGGSSNGSISYTDLYLGGDFTIDNFHGQIFQNEQYTSNYTVDDVNPTGQTADSIAGELRAEIENKLEINSKINYNLKSHSIDGDIESKRLVITYPITISAKGGSDSLSDTYSFTINFNNETTPPLGDAVFYLGDSFIIESLGGKPFNSFSTTSYNIHNVSSIDKNSNTIVSELKAAIEAKLTGNSNITYKLGTPSKTNTVGPNQEFIVKFPIAIKETNKTNNNIQGTYTFNINFNREDQSGGFYFYLGENFTIDNIGNQPFTSPDKSLAYTVDNVDRKYKNNTDITKQQLNDAIKDVFTSRSGVTYSLGDNSLYISDNHIEIQFDITIYENNSSNKINGKYSFTINFEEKVTTPTVVDFHLGDTFSISSIDNKPFRITDDKSLKYYVDEIDKKNQNITTISTQLDAAIKEVLNSKNKIKYELGTYTGIGSDDSIKITFPVTITALNDPKNFKSGEYVFTIEFIKTPPPLALSFYLGNNFTIKSIFNKYFITNDDDSLIYNIDEIVAGTIDNNTVEAELKKAIKDELDKNINITHTLGELSKTITNKQIVVQIPITINRKDNSKSSIKGTYIFTIKYETVPSIKLDFDLGKNFTIQGIDGANFISTTAKPLAYTASNINSVGKDGETLRDEIKDALTATLDKKIGVTYTYSEAHTFFNNVKPGGYVEVEYTIIMTQSNKPTNSKTEKYKFTINFNYDTIIPPKPTTPDFDLGDNFTIPGFGDKKFVSNDELSLIYTIDNVTPFYADLIYSRLQREMRKQLDKNKNLDYVLDKDIHEYSGEAEYGKTLNQQYKIKIIELYNPSNTISGIYSFTMKFKEYVAPFKPNFDIGDNFTIPSLNGDVFKPMQGTLKYLARTTADDKDKTVMINELVAALSQLHSKNDKVNHEIGTPTTTGDIGALRQLSIHIPVTLTDKTNSDNVSIGKYEFTFPFIDDAWNGSSSTEPATSADNYYLVDHATDLAWLAEQRSIAKNIRVIANINMNNKTFTGIKEFKGIFDGDNHSIKKLNIVTGTDTTALIQKITGDSIIKNIVLDIGTINGTEYTSGLIGTATGTYADPLQLEISNSTSNLNIFAGSENAEYEMRLGGFLAYAKNVDLTATNLANHGKIDTSFGNYCYIGGLIGQVDSDASNGTLTIKDSKNTGQMETIDCLYRNYIGGLVGYNDNRKTDLRNTSNTALSHTFAYNYDHEYTHLGGLIGYNKNYLANDPSGDNGLTVSLSYNRGSIASFGKHSSVVGGLIGENISPKTTVTNSHNTGEVVADTNSGATLGGLVGVNRSYNTTITNTFNSGSTNFGGSSLSVNTGGLIGVNSLPENDKTHSELSIKNAYNRGEIKGTDHTGGLIGYNKADNTSVTTSSNRYRIENKVGSSGGIIGTNISDISITDTYNIANVSGNKYNGGLVGESRSNHIEVKTSYNTGTVYDNDKGKEKNRSTGGIIGYVNLLDNDTASPNTITIEQTHNNGHVSIVSYYGVQAQILGSIKGDSINTYKLNYFQTGNPHDTENPIEPDRYSGSPIYRELYYYGSVFTGWDFTNVWIIKKYREDGHPVLRINKEY